jgi:hypothetical protein
MSNLSDASDTTPLEPQLQQELAIANRTYIRALNKDLALQNHQGMFLRNVVDTHQQLLHNVEPLQLSLDRLLQLSELFIQQALQHNRTSCAISNFPEEHQPPEQAIIEAIASCQGQCRATAAS